MTLAVVSESTESSNVEDVLDDVTIPLLVMDPALFDNLKMTGPTWQTDFGDAQSQTHLSIIDAGHPLAGGLPQGDVQVAAPAEKFIWGRPANGADKVATIMGTPDKYAIFSYDTGDAMVGRTAPAPRVGWFVGRNAPANLNVTGWLLFDAAVLWSLRQRALFVVDAANNLSASDVLLRNRLSRQFGYQVRVVSASAVQAADANGTNLVVISESTQSSDVASRLTNVAVPILCLEPALFDDLKMTAGGWQNDMGEELQQTEIVIIDGVHPLSAGFSGSDPLTVTTAASKFLWGRPGANAAKVAAMCTDSTKIGIFAYEAGASMVGLTAPAKRVGWFAGRDTPANFNDNAWALFDAAVLWAGGETTCVLDCQNTVFDPLGLLTSGGLT